MDINKVSNVSSYQTPDFIESEYPLFNRFIEYYYKSQEKTGLGQNILNNFLQYLDIDKLDIGILDGATKIVETLAIDADNITVESVGAWEPNFDKELFKTQKQLHLFKQQVIQIDGEGLKENEATPVEVLEVNLDQLTTKN